RDLRRHQRAPDQVLAVRGVRHGLRAGRGLLDPALRQRPGRQRRRARALRRRGRAARRRLHLRRAGRARGCARRRPAPRRAAQRVAARLRPRQHAHHRDRNPAHRLGCRSQPRCRGAQKAAATTNRTTGGRRPVTRRLLHPPSIRSQYPSRCSCGRPVERIHMRAGSTRVRLASLVAMAALALTTAACADNSSPSTNTPGGSTGQIKAGLKIAFLPKQVNNPYFDTSDNKGGKVAVGEFGGTYSETGPSEASPSAQVSYINTLSQQKTDVIVVSANDKDAICGALNEARQAGAKVVTYDSDTQTSCRDLFINQATAEGIAASQIKLISDAVGPDGGEIAILSATANATNQNAWIAMMKTELAKPEYSKLKLVDTVYGDDDDQKSFTEAQGLLAKHPNLKGIISPTTVGVAAAARYLSGSTYKGKVQLTGLGTPNQMRAYVKDGTVKAFALWNPADLGYLAAYAGAALASGIITSKEGDKFKAGKLGEFTVGKDASVLLGEPFTFNASNIDQFSF